MANIVYGHTKPSPTQECPCKQIVKTEQQLLYSFQMCLKSHKNSLMLKDVILIFIPNFVISKLWYLPFPHGVDFNFIKLKKLLNYQTPCLIESGGSMPYP